MEFLNRRNFFDIVLKTAIASGMAGVFAQQLRAQPSGLNLLIPFTNGTKPLIDYFNKHYGIIINITHYKNNDELLRIVIGKKIRFDLILMNGSETTQFIKHDYVVPLNYKFLKNLDNIDIKNNRNFYDEKIKYVVPLFGYHIGLGTNQKTHRINGWENIFEKPLIRSDGAQMRTDWLNDAGMMFRIALLHLNMNMLDPTIDEINEAKKFMLSTKKNINSISNLSGVANLTGNTSDLAVASNATILYNQVDDPALDFIIPAGGLIREDTVAFISSLSDNIPASHALIDLLLSPLVAKNLSESYFVQSLNKETLKIISSQNVNNNIIYPKKSKIYQARPFNESTATEIQNAWSEIYG